ncbi:hypothetical protein D3C86_1513350 [compost metagenome]
MRLQDEPVERGGDGACDDAREELRRDHLRRRHGAQDHREDADPEGRELGVRPAGCQAEKRRQKRAGAASKPRAARKHPVAMRGEVGSFLAERAGTRLGRIREQGGLGVDEQVERACKPFKDRFACSQRLPIDRRGERRGLRA